MGPVNDVSRRDAPLLVTLPEDVSVLTTLDGAFGNCKCFWLRRKVSRIRTLHTDIMDRGPPKQTMIMKKV